MPINAITRNTLDHTLKTKAKLLNLLNIDLVNFGALLSELSAGYLQNGIASVNVLAGGHAFNNTTTTCVIAPGLGVPNAASQVQAVVTLSFGLDIAVPHSGAAGTGYAVGDLLPVAGGTGGIAYVATLGASNAVATVNFTGAGAQVGFGYAIASNVATTGGTGTGCHLDITGLCISGASTGGGSLAMSQVGSGYGSTIAPSTSQMPNTVNASGTGNGMISIVDTSGGAGALLQAVLANSDTALNYLPSFTAILADIGSDMNALAQVTQGTGIVLYGDSRVITGITNAAPMVVTVSTTVGMACGQLMAITSVTPSAYNQNSTITALTATTITLSNGSAPGSAYTSGGEITVLGEMPIVNDTGYNFLANLISAAGLLQSAS
jgi:hypothetical protein